MLSSSKLVYRSIVVTSHSRSSSDAEHSHLLIKYRPLYPSNQRHRRVLYRSITMYNALIDYQASERQPSIISFYNTLSLLHSLSTKMKMLRVEEWSYCAPNWTITMQLSLIEDEIEVTVVNEWIILKLMCYYCKVMFFCLFLLSLVDKQVPSFLTLNASFYSTIFFHSNDHRI